MAAKAPQLIQQYVTGGDRSLKDWHLLLRRVTFGAALILMMASVVSLHWACNLIGLKGWWEPVAWVVPLAMETGMAAVASTATTIRKDPKPGRETQPGGYYVSLWVIFSFVMLLAQASNIGHAIVTVTEDRGIPAIIPRGAVYVFAGAFAALFPLGGTLFVHVSGFLRAHGTGARWIEDDAETVYVQVQPGAPTAAPARRTPRAQQRTQSQPAAAQERAHVDKAEEAPRAQATARAQVTPVRDELQARAREVFDRLVAANPLERPDSARVWRESGLSELDGSGKPIKNPATVRRWCNDQWWPEHQASLGQGGSDPIAEQVAADAKAAGSEDARAAS